MISCTINLHDIGNTCPICGEQALDASFDERRDGEYQDTFNCDNCGVMVTYITKDGDRRQYHEYLDGEIKVEFEWPIGHSNPMDEIEMPEAHTGFWVNGDGKQAHVQGDPNMSAEEYALVEKMIRAAMKQAEDGTLTSDNPSSER